jgi:hypothetical protein
MKLRATAACAFACAIALSACASAPQVHQPLPLAARDMMTSVDVVAPLSQTEMSMELRAQVNPLMLAAAIPGLGVLGAAIAGGIAGAAQPIVQSAAQQDVIDALKPLNEAIADYQVDDLFNAELKSSLSQVNWLRTGPVEVMGPGTPDAIQTALTQSHASAVLFVPISYRLSVNADELIMVLYPRIVPGTDNLKALRTTMPAGDVILDPANAIYWNVITYRTGLVGAVSSREDNIAKWAANGGATARGAMQLGAQKLSSMLAYSLATEAGFEPEKMGLKPVRVDDARGHVVTTDSTGSHIVLQSGEHVYVTNSSRALR